MRVHVGRAGTREGMGRAAAGVLHYFGQYMCVPSFLSSTFSKTKQERVGAVFSVKVDQREGRW
jgi:hypothetical protein